jgi:hypothetical protein
MRSTSTRLSLLASLLGAALASPINAYNGVSLFRRAEQCPFIEAPASKCVPLATGQKLLGGDVCLSLDYDKVSGVETLTVTYSEIPGFLYNELHVFVGSADAPLSNAPGSFPYSSADPLVCKISDDKKTGSCTFTLSSTLSCGTTYKFAAHAAVSNPTTLASETSWAQGDCIKRNPKGNCAPWATFSYFTVGCKDCPVITPPTTNYCELGTGFGYNSAAIPLNSIPMPKMIKRWGWYIPVTAGSGSSGTIYVGAAHNDIINKGTNVGTFTITPSASGTKVCYTLSAGYDLAQVHINVACTIPTFNDKDPGGYTYNNGNFAGQNDVSDCHTFTNAEIGACASSGTQYYILHASVYTTVTGDCPDIVPDE